MRLVPERFLDVVHRMGDGLVVVMRLRAATRRALAVIVALGMFVAAGYWVSRYWVGMYRNWGFSCYGVPTYHRP